MILKCIRDCISGIGNGEFYLTFGEMYEVEYDDCFFR